MPHIVLGLCILAFSCGVAVISFGTLTYKRQPRRFYRSFTLQFTGSTLILLAEGIRTYDLVTAGALRPAVRIMLVVLTTLGNGLLGYALPLFALDLTGVALTTRRRVVHGALAVVLAAMGCLMELIPAPPTYIVEYLAVIGLYGYAMLILIRGLRKIEDSALQVLTIRFLFLAGATALPGVVQLVLKFLPNAPNDLRQYPLVQLAYYLASVGLLMSHILRTPRTQPRMGGFTLSVDFVQRFNISPRECEIIMALEQGVSNRKLAEALFISAQTVKNHIYHIYQKTGAGNKIQLLNLIRTFELSGQPSVNRLGDAKTQISPK